MSEIAYDIQYTAKSRRQLKAATEAFVELLQQYTTDALAMNGGSAEMPALFRRRDQLQRVVEAWNDRVFEHTGTVGLFLDEDEDEGDDDGDDPGPPAEQLSVVSRWDLDIVDAEALIEAGRAAHQRMQSAENAADDAVQVDGVCTAMYSIVHEAEEEPPWFELPGVRVRGGARMYVQPDEPLELPDDDGPSLDVVRPPDGRIGFGEFFQ